MRVHHPVRGLVALLLACGGGAIVALAAGTTVTVDYSKPKQTLAGFAGLSIIRGGSMLCEFEPSPGAYNFNHYLIQSEMSWINRVKAAYGVAQTMVTTWTPPAFMKDNGSCSNGGTVLTQYYPDLANTMVLWMQDAQATIGSPIDVWSVQNEPDQSPSYDSANYTPAQFIAFVTGYLKPAMVNAGLTTKLTVPEPSIWGGPSYYDSNWGFPILQNQPQMDADIDIMSTHDYGANYDLSSPSQAALQYQKPIWQTEVYRGRRYDGSISDALQSADSIHGALNGGNFSAWFYWWTMDFSGKNQGLIDYSNTAWTYQIPKRTYVIGNFSRFMRPGSVVLTSSSTSSSIQATAVRPTSGTVAVVLTNTSKQAISTTVTFTGASTLPASVTPYRTSATENQAQLSPIAVSNGSVTITIPAQSVVTLAG
jgi:glucuronoarabinoxylan endo-1,4-beta-xylanase